MFVRQLCLLSVSDVFRSYTPGIVLFFVFLFFVWDPTHAANGATDSTTHSSTDCASESTDRTVRVQLDSFSLLC